MKNSSAPISRIGRKAVSNRLIHWPPSDAGAPTSVGAVVHVGGWQEFVMSVWTLVASSLGTLLVLRRGWVGLSVCFVSISSACPRWVTFVTWPLDTSSRNEPDPLYGIASLLPSGKMNMYRSAAVPTTCTSVTMPFLRNRLFKGW